MTINFHNNNQYNPWMQLAQQGLNMFCGNSMNMFGMNCSLFNYGGMGFGGMGFGSMGFGGLGFGGITGYNNVNYDAMAGWAVGNALLGVASQAIGSIKADRQNDNAVYADNKAQIESIDKQIVDLKAERENPKIDAKYDTDINKAQKSLANANTKVSELEAALKALQEKTGENSSQADIEAKQEELDQARLDAQTAKEKVTTAETARDDAIKARESEIEEKIKGLEAQRARLQAQVDDADLDKADGRRLQRLSDDDYAQCFNNDGSLKSSVTYTKKHARTAINHFMNAVDPDKKLKAAKNLVIMYNQYLSSDDKTTLIRNAAKIAQRYIDEHKQK